jgi:glycosyltransferase involved in cell wall biosynthesis
VRIALVTQHYAPEFEGGTERVVRAQARALARQGHDVRIVAGSDRPHEGQDIVRGEVDGLPVAILRRHPDEPYGVLPERPRLLARVRELCVDRELVHVHHWSTLSLGLVRALAARVPVVLTLHDLFTTCPRFFRLPVPPVTACPPRGELAPCVVCVGVDLPERAPRDLERELASRTATLQGEIDAAHTIVVPSRAHADALGALLDLPARRTEIVPHGLVEPVEPLGELCAWRGAGRLRVLHLGHRSRAKGADTLVRAAASLPDEARARLELLFLGAEVEGGFDEQLRALGGDVTLSFLGGYVPRELGARLRASGGAHLAALPSRVAESYGLVLDEAQALGLPAWVSARGAPPERLGAGGRILPADEPAAWARALAEVLGDPAGLEAERRAVRTPPAPEAAARSLARIYRAAGRF